MSDAVLHARALTKAFREGGQSVDILKGVDIEVQAGERLAILGSSGSGKSTLLNILGGLDRPDAGEVLVSGQSLYGISEGKRCRLRNQTLGFVYQFHHLLHEFSALENVAMPQLLAGVEPRQAAARAEALLNDVGLSHRLSHKPSKLSGGERQRVAIARALVNEPACVLMDEPTGNLDRHTAADVQGCMDSLNARLKTAFIVVTHDLSLAREMDHTLELVDGVLREV
ncbi:ATP-binding cassette domain-containing protein [Marinobacterium sp. AK62]|uniref:ATP-binding cassette domain-containing protein n=1 Tax=Marinobacterium alkalitolerans TaxID=1542925 RepID=A0ABS3ZBL5_9GAMM|nr:ATP-binding cassette domain-containing protein [Marinobacterium alkalitolerans]MBP0048658.1 ATP-binding cassette domain-containing protein [Marinobacterium alkalitolerans]